MPAKKYVAYTLLEAIHLESLIPGLNKTTKNVGQNVYVKRKPLYQMFLL